MSTIGSPAAIAVHQALGAAIAPVSSVETFNLPKLAADPISNGGWQTATLLLAEFGIALYTLQLGMPPDPKP